MMLTDALDAFKGLELKMSSAYLWCSIDTEDLELRQFYTDMSDQELAHARRLQELEQAFRGSRMEIDLPGSLAAEEERKIDALIAFVKSRPGLDEVFANISLIEAGELNLVFESICRADAIGQRFSDANRISTTFHINLLKKAAGTFPIGEATRQRILGLAVRDRDYYRVFSE